VHGIGAGINLARMASKTKTDDKSVTDADYRNQPFSTKRTVPEILTGAATNQIIFLESQLDVCKKALFADSTGIVCSAAQQNTIRTMMLEIAKLQSSWPQKAYRQELAFYVAEDARRQQVAARATPAQ
jgi:hypothetical protein